MLPTPASLEGKPVPQVTFKARPDNQWQDVTSDDLFKGKTVVLFSLPGAYTPTCSSTHLPRYNELAPVFRQNGIDDIICVSVNDAFVMNEWKVGQDAENITVIPDGNGDFSEGMGMLVDKRDLGFGMRSWRYSMLVKVDKRDLGFGMRSWRYSMLVKDGVIIKAFVEPEKEGDPFEVSDAETMLRFINPNAVIPEPVVVFSKPGCPHCARAKEALKSHDIKFTEITQDKHINSSVLRAVSGESTWPQVFMGGKLIGNADALENWFNTARQNA